MRINFSSLIYTTFVVFTIVIGSTSLHGMVPGFENLSPEEMQMLEQELQAAAQQIDEYVNSLSPAEQEEFHRAVSEVENMMSNMSEEELGQFFEQIITAEMEQQAQQQQMLPQPQIAQQPVTLEHKPAPVVSRVPLTSAEEKALQLLTALIEHTDSLLQIKTPNILDMELRFKNWAKDSKLSSISPSTTWEDQQRSILDLRQQLSDLKRTDLKTGKYLFIEPLIKNSNLYSKLEQLGTALDTYEPRVIIPTLGIQSLNKTERTATKNALRKTLDAYNTTLQATQADIKKLFEEIGPELAKIKEEEKKLTEKAQAEAAKGRQVTPGRTAGAPVGGEFYGGGHRGEEPYGYGYPSGKEFGYGDYGPRAGEKPAAEKAPKEKKDKGKETKPLNIGGKKDKETEEEKKKREEEEKKKKEAEEAARKAEEEGKKAPGATTPRNKIPTEEILACPTDGGAQLGGKYDLIASNYRYIASLLNDAAYPEALDLNILIKEPNPQLVLVVFPGIGRRLNRLNELVHEYVEQAKRGHNKEALNKLAQLHAQQTDLADFGESLKNMLAIVNDENMPEELKKKLNKQAMTAYVGRAAQEETEGAPEPAEEVAEKPEAKIKLTFGGVEKEYTPAELTTFEKLFEAWLTLNTQMPPLEKEKPKAPAPQKPPQQKPVQPQQQQQKMPAVTTQDKKS